MRILAIRGSNLASLGGDFAVELASEPLASAGLFAITGPTGAGKSTILDALCLALFDQLPRLAEAGQGGEIGADGLAPELRLRADDVRGILRHGTARGWAEVEFRGIDSRRYRARWAVHRARQRADGRLQKQEMSLEDLASNTVFAGGKTEIKELISDRLGLSFEQFRRSVLLAQGDFAAFLRAGPKERSELLERITGSGLYSRLSQASHRREAEARAARELVAAQQAGCRLLGEEERAALEKHLETTRKELARVDEKLQAALEQSEWFRRHGELLGAVGETETALEAAEEAWRQAAERRLELQRVRTVQRHRPLAERVGARRSEHDEAEAEQRASVEAVAHSHDAVAQHRDRLEKLRAALEKTEGAARERRPQLAEARLLEARAAELDTLLEQLTGQHDNAARTADETEASLLELRGRAEELEQRVQSALSWQQEHQELAELGGRWERWRVILERFAEAARELAGLEAELESHDAQLQAAAARHDQIDEQRRQAAAELDTAAADEAQLEAAAAELSLEKTADERRRAEAHLEQLNGRITQSRELVRLEAALEEARRRAAELRRTVQNEDESAAARRLQLVELRAARSEAQRAHERAVAARSESLEVLRRGLREGEACPLCGATSHPWSEHTDALDSLAEETAARLEELVSRTEKQRAELEAAETRRDVCAAELSELEPVRAAHEAELETLMKRLREEGAEPGHGADRTAALAALEDELERGRAELSRLHQVEEKGHDLQRRLRSARTATSARRQHLDSVHSQLQQVGDELHQLRSRSRELEGVAARSRSQRDESWSQLAQVLGALPEAGAARPPADPEALVASCHELAGEWIRHDLSLSEARAGLSELELPLRQAEAELSRSRSRADELGQRLAEHSDRRRKTHEQLVSLTGGRPASELEQDLEEQLEAARHETEQAERLHTEAQQDLAVAQEAVRRNSIQCSKRAEALSATQAELAGVLDELHLDEAELGRMLALDESWIADEEQALQALENERQQQRVRREERLEQLEQHERRRPEVADAAAAADAIGRLRAEQASLRESLTEHELALRQDDGARANARELARELDRATGQWQLWAALKELIGSADGSKFRGFAQSLTLSTLLHHANRQLAELARRYRLERVPNASLELQVVDRDMGQEVRSVFSLSGGESFLVSLALALGLASLSARSTQVESLFIDEGFGSLDAETLETALASLDALQSLGRQVGIISHVATLVERIGYQVRVQRVGSGRSTVRTLGI